MNDIDIVDLIYDYVVVGMPTKRYDATYDNTITRKYRKYMPGKSESTVARELLKELRSYGIKTSVIPGTDGRGKDCGLYQGGYARPMKLSKADIRDYVNKQTHGKVEDLTDYYNKYISKTIGKNRNVSDDDNDFDNTQQKFNSALNCRNNTFGFGGFDNEHDFSNTEYTDADEALPPEVIRRAIIRAAIIIAIVIAVIKVIW